MKTVSLQSVCDEFNQSIDDIQGYIQKCKNVFSEEKNTCCIVMKMRLLWFIKSLSVLF